MTRTPRITIGMPAYRAAGTIGSAIESLLAQSFGDFELIVSDNASQDATGDVVREYARLDPRIRYVLQPTNLGANPNYNYVGLAARAPLFKWASSNDWCAPTFLEACLAALDASPDAVLAAPRTRIFAGDPSACRDYPDDLELQQPDPEARLVALTTQLRLNNVMNGVIRTEALHRAGWMGSYSGADLVLMGRLALLGKFVLVPEYLFYRRMEAGAATALGDAAAIRRHHYPTPTLRALFQATRRNLAWIGSVGVCPLPGGTRWRLLKHCAHLAYWDRASLREDLAEVARYARHLAGGPERSR